MPAGRFLDLQHIVLAPRIRTEELVRVAQPLPVDPPPAPDAPALQLVAPVIFAPTVLRADASELMVHMPAASLLSTDAIRMRPRLDLIRPELFHDKSGQDFERRDSPHPISPMPQPSDTTLFEDPNSDARYWLPRYRLRELSRGRYDSNVVEGDDGRWAISLGLEAYPAAEIADAARTAQPLPHQLAVSVSYRQPNTTIELRLAIDELLTDARGPVAILRLTLAQRDELLSAFMSPAAEAKLSIVRSYTVALPVAESGANPPPKRRFQLHNRAVMMRALEVDDRVHVPVTSGMAMRADRIRRFPPPETVPEPSAAPRFRAAAQAQDVSIALVFPPALHAYLYPGGSPSAGGASWDVHNLSYPTDGRPREHAYFQSTSNPARFYYLPDEFRLARTTSSPHTPALAFVVDQGHDAGKVEVELAADVRPVTDGKRLLAARLELKKKLPTTGAATPAEVSLEPLLAKASLRLGLPRGGRMEMTQVDVDIDLANGFQLSDRFAFDDFQDVFAALMASLSPSLLQGKVLVSTGLGGDVQIPVKLNFHKLEGEIFQYSEATDPATGSVSATLRNDTGGKLRISALPVWISRGGILAEATLEGIDLGQPVEIEPDGDIAFRVVPVAPWPDGVEGLCDAIFDTSGISSVPDSESLFKQTFDNSIAQETSREITVMTDAEVLESAQEPANAIRMIVIEFRGNKSVRLSATQLEQTIEVPVPLMDILLRKDTEGMYKYRQTIIYKSGRQAVDPAWRETDLAMLFVPSL
jgi:hypothetical protein